MAQQLDMRSDIAQGRHERLLFLKNPSVEIIEDFERDVVSGSHDNDLNSSWLYAKNMDYKHEGLSQLAYLAHPIRVATLYLELVEEPTVYGTKLGLLHNLIEVSGLSAEDIIEHVGAQIAHDVELLTVDRAQQWDQKYKQAYYEQITQASLEVQQIKVLDKLDNLYMLSLNKSDDVRERYLQEIEKWIVPLAGKCLPLLCDYINELIVFNREIGYAPE